MMEQFGMYENIKAHSFKVAQVAETIWSGLDKSPHPTSLPDKQLIISGALLHDIAKTPCLEQGCRHSELGEEICLEYNYSEVAEIVKQHVMLAEYDSERNQQGIFKAKEIVFYSDKRVMHDQVVSLEDRLEYIIENYSHGKKIIAQQIQENFKVALDLEQSIFSKLQYQPEELTSHLLPSIQSI